MLGERGERDDQSIRVEHLDSCETISKLTSTVVAPTDAGSKRICSRPIPDSVQPNFLYALPVNGPLLR